MRIAQLVTGLAALMFGAPEAPAEETGRARYYSGVEWVLDDGGRPITSNAVLLEHVLDIPHRVLRTNILRESPREGFLPQRSATSVTLHSTDASPFALEGIAERDGARVDVVEYAARHVLVIHETVRAHDGQGARLHIVNATPLARDEYEPWAQRLAAR